MQEIINMTDVDFADVANLRIASSEECSDAIYFTVVYEISGLIIKSEVLDVPHDTRILTLLDSDDWRVDGDFTQPVKFNKAFLVWLYSDINDFISTLHDIDVDAWECEVWGATA